MFSPPPKTYNIISLHYFPIIYQTFGSGEVDTYLKKLTAVTCEGLGITLLVYLGKSHISRLVEFQFQNIDVLR